ncbi:MAG: hypothetical protein L0211_15460 [Planctomycetaceae bacterium]|nr:hypothetical protein [Planctomycetaceae bacterium]
MSSRSRDALRLLAAILCAVAIALAAISHVRGLLVGRIGASHSLYIRSLNACPT